MVRPKGPPTKQVRLRLQNYEAIDALRRKMPSMSTASGLVLNPEAQLTDSTVVDFALIMANVVINPDFLVISRSSFLRDLEDRVNTHIEAFVQLDPDQRSALLDMLLAASSVLAPYNLDSPLRAAPNSSPQ